MSLENEVTYHAAQSVADFTVDIKQIIDRISSKYRRKYIEEATRKSKASVKEIVSKLDSGNYSNGGNAFAEEIFSRVEKVIVENQKEYYAEIAKEYAEEIFKVYKEFDVDFRQNKAKEIIFNKIFSQATKDSFNADIAKSVMEQFFSVYTSELKAKTESILSDGATKIEDEVRSMSNVIFENVMKSMKK